MQDLIKWVEEGKIQAPPVQAFAYDKVADAHRSLESGTTIGGRVGFYLSDEFHLDLVASVTSSKAVTSFLNSDPRNAGNFREQLDEDTGFTSYMGGGNLMYDVRSMRILGLMPFAGAGIGGIINRFSQLPDKTALYFQLTGGFIYHINDSVRLNTRFTATTFSFETEELIYAEQVTYASISMGLTWMIDVTP